MPLYGKLAAAAPGGFPAGTLPLLSDISWRQPQVWGDGSTDVVLLSAPVGSGPFGYDAVNQVALANPGYTTGLLRAAVSGTLTDTTLANTILRNVVRVIAADLNAIINVLKANSAVLTQGSIPANITWTSAQAAVIASINNEVNPNT